MPNGVIRNSDVAKGVVETSLNVGVVTMTDDNVEIHCLIRLLIEIAAKTTSSACWIR